MTVKLETETIKIISVFERITHVHTKDCIATEKSIYFLVDNEKVGMAVGRNGQNIRELRNTFKRNIKIFGYSPTLQDFVKNLIPPIKDIEIGNKEITVKIERDDRPAVIGRGGENINIIKEMLKRHFDIDNLRLR